MEFLLCKSTDLLLLYHGFCINPASHGIVGYFARQSRPFRHHESAVDRLPVYRTQALIEFFQVNLVMFMDDKVRNDSFQLESR